MSWNERTPKHSILLIGTVLLWGSVLWEATRPNPLPPVGSYIQEYLLFLIFATAVASRFLRGRQDALLLSALSGGVMVGSLTFLGPLVINFLGWITM